MVNKNKKLLGKIYNQHKSKQKQGGSSSIFEEIKKAIYCLIWESKKKQEGANPIPRNGEIFISYGYHPIISGKCGNPKHRKFEEIKKKLFNG